MYLDLADEARRIGDYTVAATLVAIARDKRRHSQALLKIQLRVEGYG